MKQGRTEGVRGGRHEGRKGGKDECSALVVTFTVLHYFWHNCYSIAKPAKCALGVFAQSGGGCLDNQSPPRDQQSNTTNCRSVSRVSKDGASLDEGSRILGMLFGPPIVETFYSSREAQMLLSVAG